MTSALNHHGKEVILSVEDANIYYGDFQAVRGVNMEIFKKVPSLLVMQIKTRKNL